MSDVVTASARLLVGRTIVGFELNTGIDSDPEKTRLHNPVFILDNGARVRFTVCETYEGDGYGITPVYWPPKKESKP